MRMNDQHDTSMVVGEAVARHIDDAAVQRVLRREGDRMDQEIQLAPFACSMRSNTASIWPGDADVERHEDRRLQLARQRLDEASSPCR